MKIEGKPHKQVKILGVRVDSTRMSRVLARVRWFISHNKKFYIVTPNPELVLRSQSDRYLLNILNSASISIADGVGLSQANKFLSLRAPRSKILRIFVSFIQGLMVALATFFKKDWLSYELETIKGRELVVEIIALANKMGWRVFFLGGEKDEAEKAALKLKHNYKKLKIESFRGPNLDQNANPISKVDRLIQFDAFSKINSFNPHILFVAFGAPKQEKWIKNNIIKLNIGGAMAVGGTFRYLAGYSKLPPKWMEHYGLEWFYRLISEPYRLKRIINASLVFPWKVFIYKINNSKY